jgi:Putative glycolipid-binding
VRRTLVWTAPGGSRSEIAHVVVDGNRLAARGTQIGTEPYPYELRYEVDGDRLAVEAVGGAYHELEVGDADFFDLAYSPLFNSFPVLRDGLHRGGSPRDYVMTLVDVPSLEPERSEQRYEPLRPGTVRFRSGSFEVDLELDADGLVVRYPGLAERQYPSGSP